MSKYYRIKTMTEKELKSYIKESKYVLKQQERHMTKLTKKRINADLKLFESELLKRDSIIPNSAEVKGK